MSEADATLSKKGNYQGLRSPHAKVRVHFLLFANLHDSLEEIANEEGVTVSAVLRDAAKEYIKKFKRRGRVENGRRSR